MSEENTSQLSGSRSFEERVFARFDAIDQRLEKLESRSYDTKPIWERALKAIMETALEVGEIKKKVDTLETKFDTIETRLGKVEGDLAAMRIDYAGLDDQLIKSQSDFKKKMTRHIDMVLETVVDTHENMRGL